MAKRMRPWVKDVKVLALATGVSIPLTWGSPLLNAHLNSQGCSRMVAEAMMFVFITPAWTAREFGAMGISYVLLALNPLIYGLMWWAVWRMFRLMRAKPSEDESPPLHNE